MKVNQRLLVFLVLFFCQTSIWAQHPLQNIENRKTTSLNGKWKVIIDPFDVGSGNWIAIYKDRKPQTSTDFVEYSFDQGPELNVPGDFNSQRPELTYYENSVWYKKEFTYNRKLNKRLFIHFSAVNYKAEVYLNNKKIGTHEGGFTPFQFEITDSVKNGSNSLIVKANNQRVKDGIPGLGFDWFNYGGITRDINLVETPESYVNDYFIQLKKGQSKQVQGWVKLGGSKLSQQIKIEIPELNISYKSKTDDHGFAAVQFTGNFSLWSPEQPKLYDVIIKSEIDTVHDHIGFRTIETKGTAILLNGKSIFLKGVNIHEEIPQEGRRSYSEKDAQQLLGWAKDLGCNMVRLAHYPHSEHTIRLAEKMGLIVWEELPVYQGIDFTDSSMQRKMNTMLKEMVQRDQNRSNVIIWSLSNETFSSTPRYNGIANMAKLCRSLDSTRLITSAIAWITFKDSTVLIDDSVNNVLDIISVNEYLGWYRKWPSMPQNMKWMSKYNKPLIMSEFGGEALLGSNIGRKDWASSWSEEYQEQIYKDQLKMFEHIPFLRGVCPWILADFRSPVRMHPVYQQGWNRKGLISSTGEKKKAWFVMREYFSRPNIK